MFAFPLVAVAVLAIGDVAAAGAVTDKIARIRVDHNGWVIFGTPQRPQETCSNYGEYYRFDSRTAEGKSLLSVLLAAKLAGKAVTIWYGGVDPSRWGADCIDDGMHTAITYGLALP